MNSDGMLVVVAVAAVDDILGRCCWQSGSCTDKFSGQITHCQGLRGCMAKLMSSSRCNAACMPALQEVRLQSLPHRNTLQHPEGWLNLRKRMAFPLVAITVMVLTASAAGGR